MGAAPLQIGQVAQKTGLSVDAIRFYESLGFTASHEGLKLPLDRV